MEKEGKKRKKNRGITLIALVITIIVLLILAGVSIATLTGENGILTQANNAKTQTEIANEKEAISIAYTGAMAEKKGEGTVTAEDMNKQFGLNGTEATASGSNPIIVTFDSGREYTIDSSGNVLGPEEIDIRKKLTYAKSYSKEMLALSSNLAATEETKKYRKYFDELKVENREEFLVIHADAVSKFLLAYARNPEMNDKYKEILENLTYKGEIAQRNYTPRVQAEYMKNAGVFMTAYSRNPSYYQDFVNFINENNPYVTASLKEKYTLEADITYNKDLEEVKAAKEEVVGDWNIAMARNPSIKLSLIEQYKELTEIGKNENPSAKEQAGAVKTIGKSMIALARNPSLNGVYWDWMNENSSLVKNQNLEEVQVARAENLEALISAIYRNPILTTIELSGANLIDNYNKYLGLPPENPSERVQAITLYNNGNLLEVLRNNNQEYITNEQILKSYEKVNINITANTDEIQAASLANLGRLYWTLPFVEEAKRTEMLEFFRTKLYKEVTSNSPIVQAAKYYSEGYYDSAYQKIMKIEDEAERQEKLKTLEGLKEEFSPDIEIDYTLEEVQLAKMEFLNTIYDSICTPVGGRYFDIQQLSGFDDSNINFLQPSEEYFARK